MNQKPMQLFVTERSLAASLPLVQQLHDFCLVEVDSVETFLLVRTQLIGSDSQRARLVARLRDVRAVEIVIRSSANLLDLLGGASVSQLLLEATNEIHPPGTDDRTEHSEIS